MPYAHSTYSLIPGASQALTIAEYIYLVLAAAIKLSCLFFYWRIFSPNPKTLRFIQLGIGLIVAAYTAMFFATLFECSPIEKGWNQLTPGHCLPAKVLPYCSGAINVVTDLYVLILPIPCIWGLNVRLSRKLRTVAIFGLGILYDPSVTGKSDAILTLIDVASAPQASSGLA